MCALCSEYLQLTRECVELVRNNSVESTIFSVFQHISSKFHTHWSVKISLESYFTRTTLYSRRSQPLKYSTRAYRSLHVASLSLKKSCQNFLPRFKINPTPWVRSDSSQTVFAYNPINAKKVLMFLHFLNPCFSVVVAPFRHENWNKSFLNKNTLFLSAFRACFTHWIARFWTVCSGLFYVGKVQMLMKLFQIGRSSFRSLSESLVCEKKKKFKSWDCLI